MRQSAWWNEITEINFLFSLSLRFIFVETETVSEDTKFYVFYDFLFLNNHKCLFNVIVETRYILQASWFLQIVRKTK